MKKSIEWLLFESGISRYRISIETGIPQTTLSRYVRGETDIESMSLGHAEKLYQFYKEVTVVKVDIVEIREDFPNRDEAYAILTDGERYAFAWGHEFPFADEVPRVDIPDGESGLEWYETQKEAETALKNAVDAWETN